MKVYEKFLIGVNKLTNAYRKYCDDISVHSIHTETSIVIV